MIEQEIGFALNKSDKIRRSIKTNIGLGMKSIVVVTKTNGVYTKTITIRDRKGRFIFRKEFEMDQYEVEDLKL